MESYKRPVQAALSTLKTLTHKKTKLKNDVSSIAVSIDDLFCLSSFDKDSETSRVQRSIIKAFNTNIIPLYEAYPGDALDLAASLISAMYNAHISAYLSSDRPDYDGQLSWERVVDLGVLEGLSHTDRTTARCDRRYCIYLSRISLLKSDITGLQDYPLLETLFELIFVLRPRASAPLLREAYMKKLLRNPTAVETFGPKATQRLYQIVSHAKGNDMPQTFALLYQTLGAASDRKPQGFHISELRSLGRFIDLPADQRVVYIDQTSIFIPVPSEPGDETIGLMEVPLPTVLWLQILRPQAESFEPPIVAGKVTPPPAESLPPYVVQFTIRKSELSRLDMVIRSRSLTPRLRDLISCPTDQPVQRVATSVTPISVTHTTDAEKRGEEIRSLLGRHAPAEEASRFRSSLSPISDGAKPRYKDHPLGTTPDNYIAPRSLLETPANGVQSSGSLGRLTSLGCRDKGPNSTLSQPRPPLELPSPKNISPIGGGPTVETSPAPAGPDRRTQQLLPNSRTDGACLKLRRLAGRKWAASQAVSNRIIKVQEKTQADVMPSEPEAGHVKGTSSDQTLLVKRHVSKQGAPRSDITTDPFGSEPYLTSPGVNRLAQEDRSQAKEKLGSRTPTMAQGSNHPVLHKSVPAMASTEVEPTVANPPSLFSPQGILRTSAKHTSFNPDVVASSDKTLHKALLALGERNDATSPAAESFSQLKDHSVLLDSSYQPPVPAVVAELKRSLAVSAIDKRLELQSSPNDCGEILKVLEKIQTVSTFVSTN
ncbi:hypothetical protein FRC01_000236 [Tulasnella sp. 417]|nr:hypothetical protein FRC01_000236 [Tulasnella sp. 417]